MLSLIFICKHEMHLLLIYVEYFWEYKSVPYMVTQHTTDTRCNHDLACACKAMAFQTCFTLVINRPRDCFNIDKASTA